MADSALITGPNLERLAREQIALVSRCSESLGVVRQVKEQAWVQDTWTPLAKFGQRRDAARQDRKQQELERRGTFVLTTTVSQERLSSEELLREYKSQTSVERHFHFVKDPWFVDGWFLKKAERLEALGYVILLACLLYRLVERRVRRSGLSIPSPSDRA